MKSSVVRHSIIIDGRKTSISLKDQETADANSSAVSRLALYARTYRVLCDAGIDERLANELARERVLAAATDPFEVA